MLTAQAAYVNQCMGEDEAASKAYDVRAAPSRHASAAPRGHAPASSTCLVPPLACPQALFSFKSELDPAVAAAASNNMVALRGQRDLFDSWKKCRANLSEGLAKKLTPRQVRCCCCRMRCIYATYVTHVTPHHP